MTDDTTDSTPTDESDDERDQEPDAGDRSPESKAASLEYDWRCTGCKARYDEKPERCERCGATEFLQFRDL